MLSTSEFLDGSAMFHAVSGLYRMTRSLDGGGAGPKAVAALTLGVGTLAFAEGPVDIAFAQAEMTGGSGNTAVVGGHSLIDQFVTMLSSALTVTGCSKRSERNRPSI
jgi:hypothetical protein